MCCIAEIAAFVFGIIAIVKGRFSLTRNRVVQGAPARVIGVLLMMPLILGQGGELVYGAAIGARRGFERAREGKQFGPADVQDLQKDVIGPALVINIVGSALPLLLAFAIAVAKAEVPERPSRRRRRPRLDDDEDDEELDRRRRRRDEDEEEDDYDDRPRRRRPRRGDDEDDEDDRRIMRKD
jgi:hypothetical protein